MNHCTQAFFGIKVKVENLAAHACQLVYLFPFEYPNRMAHRSDLHQNTCYIVPSYIETYSNTFRSFYYICKTALGFSQKYQPVAAVYNQDSHMSKLFSAQGFFCQRVQHLNRVTFLKA